jgi:PAS domain S-box-containing protein
MGTAAELGSLGPSTVSQRLPPATAPPLYEQGISDYATVFQRRLDGTILFWNLGSYDMYGWSAEEALGQVSHHLLRTEFPEPLDAINAALLRDHRWQGELRHRHKDGHELVIASKWILRQAPDNGGELVIEVNSDITDVAKAEADQARLATIVTSSDAAIVGKTLDGIVTSWNKAAETIFGYRADEIVGKPISQIGPPDRPDEMREILERIKRGERIAHYETERRRKDGTCIAVSVSVSPIFDKNGRVIGASKIANDVTDRKARDRATQMALSEKEMLLREIHHRVKNNLQLIHSLLELHAASLADTGALAALTESKNRIWSILIIHQLLHGAGELARIDFRAFIEAMVSSLTASYHTEARVRLAVPAEPVLLAMDLAVPLGLVMNETLSNALKHAFPSGRPGEIVVTLARDTNGRVVFSVSDDGIGLPDHVDPATSMSLGMQLIVSLARQIRADLSVNRSGPTRFELRFEVES